MKKVTCIICFLLTLTNGCGTIMHGPTQDISVTSNPSGAIVTTTTFEWIKPPGILKLPRANSTELTAELYGYETAKQKLKCELTPWLFGNAAGEFYTGTFIQVYMIPSVALTIVDLTTGSIGVLSPTEVHFELVPKEKKLSLINLSPKPLVYSKHPAIVH